MATDMARSQPLRRRHRGWYLSPNGYGPQSPPRAPHFLVVTAHMEAAKSAWDQCLPYVDEFEARGRILWRHQLAARQGQEPTPRPPRAPLGPPSAAAVVRCCPLQVKQRRCAPEILSLIACLPDLNCDGALPDRGQYVFQGKFSKCKLHRRCRQQK